MFFADENKPAMVERSHSVSSHPHGLHEGHCELHVLDLQDPIGPCKLNSTEVDAALEIRKDGDQSGFRRTDEIKSHSS